MNAPRRESLAPYRQEAEQYYLTPEYLNQVATLNEIITSVSDRLVQLHIGIDLEGTLTCLDLLAHCHGGPRAGGFGSEDRVRRPFSNEMLVALHATSRQLMVWSSALEDRFNAVIQSSDLRIPKGAIRVHRLDYTKRISPQDSVIDKLVAAIPDAAERMHVWRYLLHRGVPKIPSGMGVDFLLDDYAQKDRPLLERICPDEAPKVLDVQPFIIRDKDELKRHHLDTGLLDACEMLAGRV